MLGSTNTTWTCQTDPGQQYRWPFITSTLMTKRKSQPSWVPPALPTMPISDSKVDREKIAGPQARFRSCGMFPNRLFISSEDWAHYITPQGREIVPILLRDSPTWLASPTSHSSTLSWTMGGGQTLRVAAVSFGEDMMETWEFYQLYSSEKCVQMLPLVLPDPQLISRIQGM